MIDAINNLIDKRLRKNSKNSKTKKLIKSVENSGSIVITITKISY